MKSTNRICIQCGEPFSGRRDKLSCSDACRAQHRRDNLSAADNWIEAEEPEEQEVYQPTRFKPDNRQPAVARPIPEDDGPFEDLYTRLAREREENANKKLDLSYCKFMNECLKADGEAFNEEDDDELRTWLDEADELIIEYRTHTGLHQSDNRAHERLDDLHWLRDKFRQMLTKWQKQETSWSGPKPVYLEFSEKRVALMRRHLKPL